MYLLRAAAESSRSSRRLRMRIAADQRLGQMRARLLAVERTGGSVGAVAVAWRFMTNRVWH